MSETVNRMERRIAELERGLRRAKRMGTMAAIGLVVFLGYGMSAGAQDAEVLRARGLVIVDEAGVQRVLVGDLGERMHGRGAGIAIFDESGAERFGVSTFPDGRITMGFDAPTGVGHAMRDRLGLGVAANGAAYLMMIDNATRVPVRIRTEPDANGIGYLEFLDWSEDLAKPELRGFQRYGLDSEYVPVEEEEGDG